MNLKVETGMLNKLTINIKESYVLRAEKMHKRLSQ